MIDRVRAALDADGLGRWLSAMARPEPGEDYVGPLNQATWLAQYAVWGERPLPYRAFNVIVHGINSAFVLRLAGYWLRGRWSAPIAAALFLFSPLAVEHAVWAGGRGDLLGATAALATINAYARFRRGGPARWKWIAAAVYALGLLASETLALLPVVLLVGERTGAFTIDRTRRIHWSALAPFALLAALFGAAWVWGGGSAPPMGLGPALRKIFIDAPSLYFAPLYPTPGRPEEFLRLAGQGFMLMIVLLSGVTARGEGRSVTLALSLILMGTVGGLLFHTQKSMSAGWRPMYLPTVGFSLFLAQVLTPPPESKRLRVSVKAASAAVLVLASIWATARNQGPWTRLAEAMSAFEEQGARLLRASPPEARVHFIGYPVGRGIHVPGLTDLHPPPLTLARLAPEASAAPRP
ncbi:MAG: hypothetical protein K8I02_04565, partial [Candidatus Methylomirabilis sp.]|nr:hypothetical protein [Deltaproteobacteria bacterium]